MINILSIVAIVLGFLLVVGAIKERHDKKHEETYNKNEILIYLLEGFYSLTIGLLSVLNIIPENRFIKLMILLCALNIFIDFKNKN